MFLYLFVSVTRIWNLLHTFPWFFWVQAFKSPFFKAAHRDFYQLLPMDNMSHYSSDKCPFCPIFVTGARTFLSAVAQKYQVQRFRCGLTFQFHAYPSSTRSMTALREKHWLFSLSFSIQKSWVTIKFGVESGINVNSALKKKKEKIGESFTILQGYIHQLKYLNIYRQWISLILYIAFLLPSNIYNWQWNMIFTRPPKLSQKKAVFHVSQRDMEQHN